MFTSRVKTHYANIHNGHTYDTQAQIQNWIVESRYMLNIHFKQGTFKTYKQKPSDLQTNSKRFRHKLKERNQLRRTQIDIDSLTQTKYKIHKIKCIECSLFKQTQTRKDFNIHKFTNSLKMDIIKKTQNQTYSVFTIQCLETNSNSYVDK